MAASDRLALPFTSISQGRRAGWLLASSDDLTSFVDHQLCVRAQQEAEAQGVGSTPASLVIHPKRTGYPLVMRVFLIENLQTCKIKTSNVMEEHNRKILIICPSAPPPSKNNHEQLGFFSYLKNFQ